jgi:hypothetical protein
MHGLLRMRERRELNKYEIVSSPVANLKIEGWFRGFLSTL